MPRAPRSEIGQLLQEARAMELLATDAQIAPDRLEDYWSLSADLITLVADIEELQATRPAVAADDPTFFALKHRLRAIASRLEALAAEF